MAYEGKQGGEFLEIEVVKESFQRARGLVGSVATMQFSTAITGMLKFMPNLRFDSPLEVMFWIWWHAVSYRDTFSEHLVLLVQQEVHIAGQVFRVDFLVQPSDQDIAASPEWTPIAIEVDGHEFHERTREQVALRDRRDRALQAAGWRVFHFSFSEFTSEPVNTVHEVYRFASNQWSRTSIRQARNRAETAAHDQEAVPAVDAGL